MAISRRRNGHATDHIRKAALEAIPLGDIGEGRWPQAHVEVGHGHAIPISKALGRVWSRLPGFELTLGSPSGVNPTAPSFWRDFLPWVSILDSSTHSDHGTVQ
jgi:hypothetical protein